MHSEKHAKVEMDACRPRGGSLQRRQLGCFAERPHPANRSCRLRSEPGPPRRILPRSGFPPEAERPGRPNAQVPVEESYGLPRCRTRSAASRPYGAESSVDVNLVVLQDSPEFFGPAVQAPTVLDNLIHQQIPMTVGLLVAPGKTGPDNPMYGGTGNRSIELNSTRRTPTTRAL